MTLIGAALASGAALAAFAQPRSGGPPPAGPPDVGCPCHEGGPGMMGGKHESMGHHGMHGMHGMMGGGCPMAGMDADVKVEKTKNGAVIRLAAKDPAKVTDLQRMALMVALHFGADPAAMMPTSPEGKK